MGDLYCDKFQYIKAMFLAEPVKTSFCWLSNQGDKAMPAPFKILILLLVLLLSTAAIMPLVGYHFAVSQLKFIRVDEIPFDLAHLLVVHSACFSALSYFGINYLRRKRPLSSVEPVLVFSIFLVIFGLIFMFLLGETSLAWLLPLGLIATISIFLYRENEAETKTIFKDYW